MNLQALRNEREQLLTRARELIETAATEGRDLDDTEDAEHGQAVERIGEINRLVTRGEKLERVALAAMNPANREPGSQPDAWQQPVYRDTIGAGLTGRLAESADVRTRALAILDSEPMQHLRNDGTLTDAGRSHLERLVRADSDTIDGSIVATRLELTENEHYRSAFMKYARYGGQSSAFMSPEEQRAVSRFVDWEQGHQRAMSEASGGVGLYGIPVSIDPTIMITSGAVDLPILKIARIEQISTNAWKGVSSVPPVWSFDAEATEVSDDSVTLAQPTVTAYTARGFIPASWELSQDYPGFAAEMLRLLAAGYIDLIASKLVTGTGTAEPKGVVVALDATAASEVLLTTAGSFGAVDVFNAWNSLGERFRGRGSWLMNVAVESQIRQFANNANNTAYFTVDLTQDGISRINGRPVYLTDYMPTWSATTGHQNRLVVGDFQGYLVAQRIGMSVVEIPMLFSTGSGRPTGQRGLYGFARIGSDVVSSNSLRLLNQT